MYRTTAKDSNNYQKSIGFDNKIVLFGKQNIILNTDICYHKHKITSHETLSKETGENNL